MFFVMYLFYADDVREVGSSHTTVRRLDVISQIVKKVGKRRASKEILKRELIEWNISLEKIKPSYSLKKGKLVEGTKATSAYSRYLKIAEEFGLISSIGHTISLTKTGNILNHIVNGKDDFDYFLSFSEKMFYLYLLLNKDADYLLLAIDIVF